MKKLLFTLLLVAANAQAVPITDFPSLAETPANGDVFPIVDISVDTTKKITYQQLMTGILAGNAATATALAANPTDCGANNYATAIAANGDLTCAQVSLTAGVTGTLPAGNGGTGVTSLGTGVATGLGTNINTGAGFVTTTGSAALTNKSVNGLTVTTSTGTLTVPNGVTMTGPASSGTTATLGNAETFATGTKTVTSKFDFGGGTLEVPNSTSLPGTCVVGEAYMDTNATSGARWYLCESSNTWVAQGGGGGGSGCTTSGADGEVLTDDGAGGCTSNTGLTYDGTDLTVIGGNVIADNIIEAGTLTDEGICTYESTGPLMDCSLVPGTGVATALAVNVGSAGAPVLFNGALGTPSSGTVTNLTGTASININGTVGATTPTTGVFTTGVFGSTTSLLLGTAGSAVGNIGFRNATSGTITLAPTTGALGTVTLTMPATSGTILQSGTAVTVAQGGTGIASGTSGGIPYFSGSTTVASSAALAAGAIVVGGGAGTTPATTTTGTGVVTALGVNTGSAGAFGVMVVKGTSAMGTSLITSGACATVVTTTATGTATTDVINWGFNTDPTAITGYAPSASGGLFIYAYPSSGNVNFKVCNNTAGSITPGAMTLNWIVIR